MSRQQTHRTKSGERGQAIVLVLLLLVPLLAIVGLVIDVGYAYYAQRSLQRQADAAALAGASQLPDASASLTMAKRYGSSSTGKNKQSNLPTVTENVATKCLSSVPSCSPVNAVVVDETADVPTLFTRLVGYNSFKVHVRATACSPCGVKPLDIMVVFDRTLSMCMDHNGNMDSSCTDLNNARNGIKSFLGAMYSDDWVGLAEFPPPANLAAKCAAPQTANGEYDSKTSPYVVVPLSKDFISGGKLVNSSNLVSTVNCTQAGGTTAYANALEAAQAELDKDGRPNVQDVIVFFSDGAANTGPGYYPTTSPYRKQPCHQGVTSAGFAKAKGTLVYSIGYDLNAMNGGANKCQSMSPSGPDESPAITAYQALQSIASNSGTFYNQPAPGQLVTLFQQVAQDIQRGAAGLIDNATP